MRVIEVEEEREGTAWLWWMAAGTALGVAAGVLASERFSGRRTGARSLLRRVRALARTAALRWEPLLEVALEMREAWAEGRRQADLPAAAYDDAEEFADDDEELEAGDDELEDEFDEELEEDLDDIEDNGDNEDLEDSDEDYEDDEDFDDSDEDEDEAEDNLDEDPLDVEEDGEDADPESVIGSRVLEAFLNDPILVEREVEIEADDEGAVLLHGEVHASKEIPHAVTIAGGVPGVTSVRQRLRVRLRRTK